jgi:hypothetical protein
LKPSHMAAANLGPDCPDLFNLAVSIQREEGPARGLDASAVLTL